MHVEQFDQVFDCHLAILKLTRIWDVMLPMSPLEEIGRQTISSNHTYKAF